MTFLLAVLLVAYSLSNWAFRSEADAKGIATALDGVFTLDPRSAVDAVRAFELRGALGATFTLALSFLLIAAPVASAFRLQRMLLNRYPDGAEGIGREAFSEHAWRTEGVFELEARTFTAFGEPPPRERPIDLIVRAVALLMPIWLALVLAVVAATGSTSGSRILGDWSAPALAVGAGVIFLLALDSLILTRRTARRRLSMEPSATPTRARMLPRPVRLVALVVTSLALAAGVFGFVSPGAAEPTETYANVRTVTAESPVSFGQWLTFSHVGTAGMKPTDPQLRMRGVMIHVGYELAAPSGSEVKVRAIVFDAKTGRIVSENGDLRLLESELGRKRSAGEQFKVRELILLRVGEVRRPPPKATPKPGNLSFWFPVRNPGAYLAEITLFDALGVPLDVVRTKKFAWP